MQQYTKKLPLQQKQKYFISMAEVFFTVSEKHISVITQAGYEIISFDYPLAPAADLEQIVPDICDSA